MLEKINKPEMILPKLPICRNQPKDQQVYMVWYYGNKRVPEDEFFCFLEKQGWTMDTSFIRSTFGDITIVCRIRNNQQDRRLDHCHQKLTAGSSQAKGKKRIPKTKRPAHSPPTPNLMVGQEEAQTLGKWIASTHQILGKEMQTSGDEISLVQDIVETINKRGGGPFFSS